MKEEKEEFVLTWIEKNDGADTMNCYFVDEYVKLFNPKKINFKNWGADNVPELTALLRKMYYENKITRKNIGIPERPSGFPKWVWVYYKS